MLTKRRQKLIRILEQDRVYHNVAYLAKQLGVSERTLYSEIKNLKNTGFQIDTKRGKGVALIEQERVNSVQTADTQNSAQKRRLKIMADLLFENATVTLNGLSEKYFVSQTSIKNDLRFVEKILAGGGTFKLFSDRQGTRILNEGLEQRLSLLVHFNRYVMDYVQNIGDKKMAEPVDRLSSYYPLEVISVCKNLLYTFVRKNLSAILETYVENFLSLYIALVSQLMLRKHIEKTSRSLDKQQHAFYIGSAVSLLHKASLRLQFDYSNDDVEYLSQMLLNYRFEQVPVEKISDEVVEKLITQVSQALDIDFLADKHLLEQLKVHIPAMIYRLKFQTLVKNPFTEQIKLEFSIIYNVLWIVMEDFGQEIGIVFNEDEIAFLTIYFQLAIEKIGRSRKILIVCHMGIVTSELLINRIKKSVPSLDEVEVASLTEMKELDLSQYDFVLTTIKTRLENDNVHYVSPFIKTEEITALLNASSDQSAAVDEVDHSGSIPVYYPLLEQEFASKEDLLQEVSQLLYLGDFVTEDFAQSLLEREQLGSTEFPLGVAIPHGNPVYVKQTVVVYIKNVSKFKWTDTFVDTIFLVAIAKEDMKQTRQIISSIYRLINDEARLKLLKEEKQMEEVQNILYGRK